MKIGKEIPIYCPSLAFCCVEDGSLIVARYPARTRTMHLAPTRRRRDMRKAARSIPHSLSIVGRRYCGGSDGAKRREGGREGGGMEGLLGAFFRRLRSCNSPLSPSLLL